ALGYTIDPQHLPTLLENSRMNLDRQVFRLQVVRWLLEENIPVSLYGNGWTELREFAHLAKGPVAPGADLAKVYQRSKVLLHVNTGSNCHMRLFEGIASGGFVVARACHNDSAPGDLASRLEIGKEIMVFSSKDELLDLVRRAFADEPWRRGVIAAGAQRVRENESYARRVRDIVSDLGEMTARMADSWQTGRGSPATPSH
ncbi:MAG: glycosyltransferase, partial [Pseudomonadota bacterium]